MVLVSIVCLLSDHYRVNVTLSVVHVYMFISRFIGTNYTYMCVAIHIRRSVVRFHLCLLIFGSPNRFLRLQTFGLCSPHPCLLLPISHSSRSNVVHHLYFDLL
ncbi:uncharacterized protein K441DRAFT_239551 [Cenococcum geophilum 1.58]|uniref:uncharacterized protein n=1 Tax=Cenococcum geophilum 1.58 TaxID=794803 RepID=UPI00358F93D1|nr:hypothetical protein K441DRAFT_239551 [Cenococcum geophilum 1.58]